VIHQLCLVPKPLIPQSPVRRVILLHVVAMLVMPFGGCLAGSCCCSWGCVSQCSGPLHCHGFGACRCWSSTAMRCGTLPSATTDISLLQLQRYAAVAAATIFCRPRRALIRLHEAWWELVGARTGTCTTSNSTKGVEGSWQSSIWAWL
jgi:hypothetical protein